MTENCQTIDCTTVFAMCLLWFSATDIMVWPSKSCCGVFSLQSCRYGFVVLDVVNPLESLPAPTMWDP